ncbi:dTMP kinase [Coraliomargarita akajimensis]|uniref:Thymidylate kinase n=1 Tax=Coraliomargarita akajimensis (strain DSM 45221 / IAM 15411 / JCM 23193 / KCTC 12865 / 04OKA010-24) TaxID=583355 RepID=D5EQG2_CORAD|nr:dTMP kinase [Coraliomargarita akajimensis]ADE55776.1 thymidylate kinase [Coraliomargarita akajimensis DSM 45221]
MDGLFISFEGSEGCGKSTQIRALASRLEAEGIDVVRTREPGGTPLSEAIRNLLQHDEAGEGMCAEAELLLFAAARAQLTREVIAPARRAGKAVLSDRFMDSTTVYQGVARALAHDDVAAINQFAVGTHKPDLTILIDLDPEVGLQRVKARSGGQLDRMEREALDFFQAVRQGYLALAEQESKRFLVLDGNHTIEALEQEIWNAVRQRLT